MEKIACRKKINFFFLWNKNSKIDEMNFKIIEDEIKKIFKKADMFKV